MTDLEALAFLCLSMPKPTAVLAADRENRPGIGQIVLDRAISRSRNGA